MGPAFVGHGTDVGAGRGTRDRLERAGVADASAHVDGGVEPGVAGKRVVALRGKSDLEAQYGLVVQTRAVAIPKLQATGNYQTTTETETYPLQIWVAS